MTELTAEQVRVVVTPHAGPRIETAYPPPWHTVFPYLLRGLSITAPNQVWGVDITYIRLARGWAYLVAVLDWYSRYVVSWELDLTLEIPCVLEAMGRALEQAKPDIVNSDQGSHFTSPSYISLLQEGRPTLMMTSWFSSHCLYTTSPCKPRIWRLL